MNQHANKKGDKPQPAPESGAAGDHHHCRTYVVTHDIGPKVACFRSNGLNTPDPDGIEFRRFLADTRDGIIRIIGDAFKDGHTNTRSITMDDLADEILAKSMKQHELLRGAVVISTCAEIAARRHGHTLEINRIIDRQGKIIGRGPRPGYPVIDEQIEGIAAITNGLPLILAEDGAFSGETMIYLLERFKRQRLSVNSIVIGFGFPEALASIGSVFKGEIIVEHVDDFVDWMPDHDFMPFLPNCGRVLGIPWDDGALPLYTHNGASYSVPYILPFCPMSEWTRIPQKHCYDLSCFCVEQTRKLFEMLDKLNNRRLTIGELIYTQPRVSIPMAVGQSAELYFPRLDTEVSSYLEELQQELSNVT